MIPRLSDALTRSAGLESSTVTSVVSPVASPAFQGVEHDSATMSTERSGELFVQVLHDEKSDILSFSRSMEAAEHAGRLGVSPRLVVADADSSTAVFQALRTPWRTATMADLSNPDVLARVFAAQVALHRSAPLTFSTSVFDEMELLHGVACREGALLPADIDFLVDAVRLAGQAVGLIDRPAVPCHGDTIASNVLLTDSDARVCDFDRSGNADPLSDLAVLLSDAFLLEEQWVAALQMLHQPVDPVTLALLHVYAAADDVSAALRAQVYALRSRGRGLEYAKYGGWRFLKARWIIQDRRFESWLRKLS